MSPTILKWVFMQEETPLLQTFSLFSLVLAFILLLIMFRLINRAYQRKRQPILPPSPPNKLPILGHLHQLGTLPHRNLRTLAQRYGPNLMLLHLGQAPTLIVTSAESAREILKTHDHVFPSRPPSYISRKIFYNKDFIFAPYSEYQKQMRRVCILQLLSIKRVQSFRSVREEETAVMIDKISRRSTTSITTGRGRGCGRVINLSEMLLSLTNDITCRATFGRKYCGQDDGKNNNFGKMVQDINCLLGVFNVGDFIPWLSWVNNFNGLNKKVEKTFKQVDDYLERLVDQRIRDRKEKRGADNGANGGGGSRENIGQEDLLDVLLGIQSDGLFGVSLDRDNIKAIILDIFVGGTDTGKVVLEWAMAELIKQPKMLKQVQEEIRGIAKGKPKVMEEDLGKMHYMQCVIKETLRLHPPATLLVPHQSIKPVKLQGYDIPAGTRVMINAWAIARDPISWEEPEKFEPQRFMNSSIDFKGLHTQFIPFGAGRRGCPGIQFATCMTELALANLLYRYDWKLPNGASEDELDMAELESVIVTCKKSPLLVLAIDHLSTCESTI